MVGQYPRLRTHVRRRKSGKVVTYYTYDMRSEGEPDIALGTDWDEAVKRWEEIHNEAPRIAGTLEEAFKEWERDVLPLYENAETKRGYAKHLRQLRPAFAEAAWHEVTLPDLKGYLKKRGGKTQANREMSVLQIIWNWARLEGKTDLHFPAAGMERSGWRNKERPRKFKVTDSLFDVVYAEGDQVLRDCMDLATATGMRLTDCRSILLPRGDLLELEANKTGKEADFQISLSSVLPELVERRRAIKKAVHLMLLSTPTGRPVSLRMLNDRWGDARKKAAAKVEQQATQAEGEERADLLAFAQRIKSMYLRDMRKRASDLAGSDEEAAALLQHGSVQTTRRHYRTQAVRLKTVR